MTDIVIPKDKRPKKTQLEKMNVEQLEKLLTWIGDSPLYADFSTEILAELARRRKKS